jgi:SAM-dependent methyltransferase
MKDEEYRAMFDLEEHLWWYRGMRAITASLLSPHLGTTNRRLLDIGCGTGFSMTWLRKTFDFNQAFGIDLSPLAATFWKTRELDTVALGSADRLPFLREEFDLVTCFDVIYQLNDERASKSVAEMHRVLSPGGFLFIREPAYQWMRGAHDVAVGTRRRYTLVDLRRLLIAHGFKIRRTTYSNTLLFSLAAPHRLLSKWRRSTESDVKPVPKLLNTVFGAALNLEAKLLRDKLSFPFGLSAIIVAQKER